MNLFSIMAIFALAAPATGQVDVKEVSKDVVGAWKLDFMTPEYERRTPIAIVGRQRDEMVGWYVGAKGIEPFSKVQFAEDALHLTIKPKEYNGEVTATLVARLEKPGASAGTIEYADISGDKGTIKFTGKKITLDSFEDVFEWELDFVTPDQIQRRPRVTAVMHEEKLYGWYSSEEYELPVTKLTNEGDDVVMELSAKTADGEKIDLTFRGVLGGNQISGEAEWKMEYDSGSFPFTGRLKQ
jgi:hypothetical protein